MAGDLDRRGGDPAAGRLDENSLACAHFGASHQHMPGGDIIDRDSGGLVHRERLRLGETIRRRHSDLLGHPAIARGAVDAKIGTELVISAGESILIAMPLAGINDDLVARLEAAVGWSLQHHPRGVAAWNDRQGKVTLTAKADPDIKMIQAAG